MTRLYRSTRDKKLFGLCGGLAESFNIDATIIRLIFAVTAVFSAGTTILIYLVACMVIPKEETFPTGYASYPPPFEQKPYNGGWQQTPHSNPSPHYGAPKSPGAASQSAGQSDLDHMMKDIERKALLKELEELRMKVAKLEQSNSKEEKGE